MNRWLAPLLSDSGDEHLLHRLEAFSDIVIGFCLAELTLSLGGSNPSPPSALQPATIASFGFGFFTIANMWWFHNRLFAKFFVLNAVSIVANFAMLGALMLMIYFAQRFTSLTSLTPVPTDEAIRAIARYWFESAAIVYALLGGMYAQGIAARWAGLSVVDRRFGVRRAFASLVGAGVFAVLATAILSPHAHARSVLYVAATLAVIIALSRFVIPRLVRSDLSSRA